MAVIPSKIWKLETPKSESDSNYEEYEFMLFWYGRDNEPIVYLFTDWEQVNSVKTSFINRQDSTKLRNIINRKDRTVRVVAEDLTLNDANVLESIYEATEIKRLFKDGTTQNIGTQGNERAYRQTDGRYNLEIDIILYEKPLAK